MKLLVVPLACIASILAFGFFIKRERPKAGFAFSTLSIICLMATYGLSMFPNLVFSLGGEGVSLKLSNAASSEKTLFLMLVMALIGLPIVILYTIYVYRVFRGPVKPGTQYH